MKEKLSALMDGELGELEERRVLDALTKDARLRAAWERYHLMRAAITRQLDIVAPAGLADKIAARLGSDVVMDHRRHSRLFGGLAAAAALAAVTIFAVQSLQSPPPAAVSPSLAVNQIVSPEPAEGPLNVYLVGHNEFMPIAGMGGMLPYVRVVTYDRDK